MSVQYKMGTFYFVFSGILDDIFRGTQGEGDTHGELHPLLHRGQRKQELKYLLPLLAMGRILSQLSLNCWGKVGT